jgi:hypothetical protein
MMVEEISIF